MASDIAVKIRAVAKEREQLQAAVEKVGAKETALRRQMTTLDREKERIEGRIAEIDAALRPLESLLGVNPGPSTQARQPRPVVRPTEGTQRSRILAAIGRRDLDEFSAQSVADETGELFASCVAFMDILVKSGQLHRVRPRVYRIARASAA
jgi:DNA repair exonuclease SbcCD ATPase subunit